MHSNDPYAASSNIHIGSGSERVRVCYALMPWVGANGAEPAPVRFLLLHGNPSHMDHWGPMLPALRELGDVLLYDLPGFGRSEDWPDGTSTLERYADASVALLDALDWRDPVVVIGQSHGGLVASMTAIRAPSRVRGLVCIATVGTPAHASYRMLQGLPFVGTVLENVAHRLLGAASLQRVGFLIVRQAIRPSFSPEPTPDQAVLDEITLFRKRPQIAQTLVRVTQDDPCAKIAREVSAGRLQVPALFVHGEQDALVPIRCARGLHTLVLAQNKRASRAHVAEFVAIAGGHMVHYTHPARIIAPLMAWLRGLGS